LGEFYFSCPKKISKRRTIPYFSLHSWYKKFHHSSATCTCSCRFPNKTL
jgi:hypothetical protein